MTIWIQAINIDSTYTYGTVIETRLRYKSLY